MALHCSRFLVIRLTPLILTCVELQLKKSEAVQRWRLENEKAPRESEAEGIRMILGQDSNRKKKEEKNKKCLEELAQGKAADAFFPCFRLCQINNGANWQYRYISN